jgi:hypothetical protein
MKHDSHIRDSSRFRGGLRHYHRKGSEPPSSWDEWIDPAEAAHHKRNWWRVILVVLGLLALAGIAVGLYIEMG